MMSSNMVALGARIPEDLKTGIADYCRQHGVKMQFFVVQALREKLLDIQEIMDDSRVVSERMKDPQFVSLDDLKKQITARKKAS